METFWLPVGRTGGGLQAHRPGERARAAGGLGGQPAPRPSGLAGAPSRSSLVAPVPELARGAARQRPPPGLPSPRPRKAATLPVRARIRNLQLSDSVTRPRRMRLPYSARQNLAEKPARRNAITCGLSEPNDGRESGDRSTAGARRRGTGFHAARRRRQPGVAVVAPRPAGHRLLLPGRADPRLHQAGVRLHRRHARLRQARAGRARHLAGRPGQAGQVPGEGADHLPAAVRPGQDGP